MACYLVTAKPKPGRLENLRRNLRRKGFASLRPFGRALTYSLENARLREDGCATWEEEDYCTPPLAQERAAVLGEFFDELNVEPVQQEEGWKKIQGLPRLFPGLEA